jgi:hypothetical protein
MGGATNANNKLFEWPVMQHVKGNYSLIPIVGVIIFGCGLCGFQILRTLIKNPDVHLNKTKNPRPWEKLSGPNGEAIQFKYFTTKDYSQFKSERPKLD